MSQRNMPTRPVWAVPSLVWNVNGVTIGITNDPSASLELTLVASVTCVFARALPGRRVAIVMVWPIVTSLVLTPRAM
jgi:hypothetical protein